MNLQKDKPYRSKKYMDYVKRLPCLVQNKDCRGEVQPAHLGARRTGSDLSCIPLCHWHHNGELHQHGPKWFEDNHTIDLQRANQLNNREYIERQEIG